jgi:hypothetical protein
MRRPDDVNEESCGGVRPARDRHPLLSARDSRCCPKHASFPIRTRSSESSPPGGRASVPIAKCDACIVPRTSVRG